MWFESHFIQDSSIIGYGPLLLKSPSDPAQETMYGWRQLSFTLYLQYYSTEIESNKIYMGMVGDVARGQDRLQDFRMKYADLVKQLDKILYDRLPQNMPI